MDALLAALPKLLFGSFSALPLAIGLLCAMRHRRAGSRSAYLQHLGASMAAGAVALGLLWTSLFGDNLSRSSTAALIFVVAPVYAAVAQAIVYGIAAAVFRESAASKPIGLLARLAMLVPLLMLAVLMFGLVKVSVHGNESAIAERASDPQALRRLLAESRSTGGDEFGVALHMAQNPGAPPDILTELARHDHPTVRAQVARNAGTPPAVVAALRYDCASFVRKIVVERLGPDHSLQPAPAPTGKCALERWR